jgi:hypothetical protein
MRFIAFTVDRLGNPGHPTRRFDQIRKLKKRRQIRIIGGGVSGKPTVVLFFFKSFDTDRTVSRRFVRVIDPGYQRIGFAVCEIIGTKLVVLMDGNLESRIEAIRGLMQQRKGYRRSRRHIARFKMRRISYQKNRVLTKFKKPRNVRSLDKTSATLQHGVDVHLALYGKLHKLCPLPVFQTVIAMEQNTFDVRTMTWGAASGKGYQQSPRTESAQPKVCILCGTDKDIHKHHLIQRKKQGTDVAENKVYVCKGCHGDIHAGRVYLPIKGVKQHRALGTMNAIAGVLNRMSGIRFVLASDMATKRRELGLQKDHGLDAVCAAAALFDCATVDYSRTMTIQIKKFRRHNRARIHALRDRNYNLDSKIVAKNRNKRCDQHEDSLAEFGKIHPESVNKLKVYPGVRLLNPLRKDAPTIGGDSWLHKKTGQRFVATGVLSVNYLFSPDLKGIVGKAYVSPAECRRMTRNEGMVICTSKKQ